MEGKPVIRDLTNFLDITISYYVCALSPPDQSVNQSERQNDDDDVPEKEMKFVVEPFQKKLFMVSCLEHTTVVRDVRKFRLVTNQLAI